MSTTRGSADTLFTIAVALCAVVITFVFIGAGGAVARATFSPHGEHTPAGGDSH